MKSFVDKLNLKSSELRFLGLVALVVFAMLNVWLVWPHFYEWATAKDEIAKSRKKLKDWQVRIERRPQQEEVLRRLEKQGPTALMEGQAPNLVSWGAYAADALAAAQALVDLIDAKRTEEA